MSATPAQLGFLAIYNPSLGTTDDTIGDQIIYYASQQSLAKKRRHRRRGGLADAATPEERNERQRQIGLAQGMVEFGRSFAGDQPVDFVETERSRVIVHELEPGWWILASIQLTRLPLPPKLPTGKQTAPVEEKFEYSTRDVKPASLLLRDLVRAHSIFLLHHAPSLSSYFETHSNSRFISVLGRYWDLFLSTWDVMLHGNPIRSLFGGINLAASGELGVGVGEEDLGSSEREVLEGLPWQMEGLVDLVVSKFGTAPDAETDDDPTATAKSDTPTPAKDPWLGSGKEPSAEDGAVFLGVGALSRESLRDVVQWTEDLYTWGENAYGVVNPSSTKFTRKSRRGTVSNGAPQLESRPIRKSVSLRRSNSIAEDNLGSSPRRRLRAVPPIPLEEPPAEQPATNMHMSQSFPRALQMPASGRLTGQETSIPESVTGLVMSQSPPKSESLPEEGSQTAGVASGEGLSTEGQAKSTVNPVKGPAVEGSIAKGLRALRSPSPSKSIEAAPQLSPIPSLPPRPHSTKPMSTSISSSPNDSTMEKFKSYLRLGYGTYWSLGGNEPKAGDKALSGSPIAMPDPRKADDIANHFLIGLRRESDPTLAEEDESDVSDADSQIQSPLAQSLPGSVASTPFPPPPLQSPSFRSRRAHRRTVRVKLAEADNGETAKLRVVVYTNQPFVFVLLFDPAHPSTNRTLSSESLYRTLHGQLGALRKSLMVSTAARVPRPDPGIFDLVYDPASLTLLCSVPNIPIPPSAVPTAAGIIGGVPAETRREPWLRTEAMQTHAQMLNIRASVANKRSEVERTCKTSRGWWIVWTRVFKDGEGEEGTASLADSISGALPAVAGQESGVGGNTPVEDAGGLLETIPESPVGSFQHPSAGTTQDARKQGEDEEEEDNDDDRLRHSLTASDASFPSRSPTSTAAAASAAAATAASASATLQHLLKQRRQRTVAKEVLLVRRASDHAAWRSFGSSLMDGGADGGARLGSGIGVDTRRYVEGLLNVL